MLKTRIVTTGFFGILMAAFFMISGQAFAACTNPAGTEGNQVYNTTYRVMQYCDGAVWVSMKGGVGVLASPPTCNGANDALQWDGSNWGCATIAGGGGGGGPLIVNGDHTQQDCLDDGGTINTIDFGGDILCTYSGNGCPAGWTVYGDYKRSAKTCGSGVYSSICNATQSCTIPGGWVTGNGARSCNYLTQSGFSCFPNTCTQGANVGVTDTACY